MMEILGMVMNVYVMSIIFALIFLIIVINLVRKNKLLEKYSILWGIFALAIFVFAVFPNFTIKIASILDIKYAPALLFLIGILFLFFYVLYLTKVISKQEKCITSLAQEIAILKNENKE